MERLREHMRNHLSLPAGENVGGGIIALRSPSTEMQAVGEGALQLVERAIQIIRDREDDAAARHSTAESLARSAIEELKLAESRVRAAEMARRAAAGRLAEVSAKLREVETALERSQSTVVAAEARIEIAEQRARTAEMRAMDAENTLRRIETTIRAQVLDRRAGGAMSNIARCA